MQDIYVVKIFQILRGTKRRSVFLVKLKTSPDFLKLTSTTDIYSEFSKIFTATIFSGDVCLNFSQEITVYWCDWFYFCVRPIWPSKECFSAKVLVKRGTRTPCNACLKNDTISLYAQRQFLMYRLKIVAHAYMKLWVHDNMISLSFWCKYIYVT